MNLSFLKFSKKFYFSYPCPRKLREIVKITLFEREQPQKIKEIWQTYYSEKTHAVGMDISGDELSMIVRKYNKLNKKILIFLSGQANPFFVFPVRKDTGHYVLVAQNQDKSFIYTFLEDYKANPSNATPYLVVTMFDELVFKKGVGLIRGDVIGDLSKKETEIIFNMTRHFYTNDSYYQKVITFNREPTKFNYQEHINSCLSYYDNPDLKF